MSLNLIPHSLNPLAELLTRAAFAPLANVGWLRVTGEDRVRWLNGMVTNSIQTLKPGEGCYNFFLNAQGRIQADATAWMREDCILLETGSAGSVATMLDHFIIMDDVELTVLSLSREEAKLPHDLSGTANQRAGVLVVGQKAGAALDAIGLQAPAEQLSFTTAIWRAAPVDLIHAYSPIVPRFEVWSDSRTILSLTEALTQTGALQANSEALEHLRILEGTPLYGTDIRNTDAAKDLPQETAQTRALHFAKGCYLGQEIVERIRSRGAVHRTFSGFTLEGALPPAGTPLYDQAAPDRPIGELTSVARIPLPDGPPVQLALGYVRREALERKAIIVYPDGAATPATLPFALAPQR